MNFRDAKTIKQKVYLPYTICSRFLRMLSQVLLSTFAVVPETLKLGSFIVRVDLLLESY